MCYDTMWAVRFRPTDLLSRAWSLLPSERRAMVGLGALAVVAAQAESAALVLVALLADAAARASDFVQVSAGPIDFSLSIGLSAALAATAIGAASWVGYIYGRLAARNSARLEREGRDRIVESYSIASWQYQASQKSSRVQGRLLRLMDARGVAFSSFVNWIRAVATIGVFITAAAVMSLTGAFVIVLFGGLLSLAVLPVRRRVGRLGARTASMEVGVAADFAEALDHGSDVKVFGAWPSFVNRYQVKSNELEEVRASLHSTKALMPVVYQYGALALILGLLVLAVQQGGSQFGQLAASALLLLRSVQYGQQMQLSLQNLAEAVPRIDLLDLEVESPDESQDFGSEHLDRIKSVRLENLSYRYPGEEALALEAISLTLKPGTIYGIAGPSGSGKSTLAQVLLRLRRPERGAYLVNGRPAYDFSPESWRRLVTHVPQSPLLLHGTLEQNVSFLDESITSEQCQDAINQVGLTELLSSLPNGLNTELGPTNRNLSGGQTQRIGIARALARRPQMLILDEPTSALDIDSERVIGEALRALVDLPDILVLVIAHRPSTLALCEQIIVLDEGRISQTGQSDQLGHGFLRRLFASDTALDH